MAGWEANGWGAMVATLALGQILQYLVGHMAKFQELVQIMLRGEVLWISVGSQQEQQFDAVVKGLRKLGFLGVAPYTTHSPPPDLALLPCALGYYPQQTRPLWKRILFPLATRFIFPTTYEGYATHHGGKHSCITLYMSAAKAQLVFDVGSDAKPADAAADLWRHYSAGEQWRARVGIQLVIVAGLPLGFLILLCGVGASRFFVGTLAATGVTVWVALVIWEACGAPYTQTTSGTIPPERSPNVAANNIPLRTLEHARSSLLQTQGSEEEASPSNFQLFFVQGYHQACAYSVREKCKSFRLTGDPGAWQPEVAARAVTHGHPSVSFASFSACLPGCNPTDICSQHRNAQLDVPFLLVVDLVVWVNGQAAQRPSIAVPGASHGTLPNFHDVNTLVMALSSETQYLKGVHLAIIQRLKERSPAEAWGWGDDEIKMYNNAVNHLTNSLNLVDLSHEVPELRKTGGGGGDGDSAGPGPGPCPGRG